MGSRSKYNLSRSATHRGPVRPEDLGWALNVQSDRVIGEHQHTSRRSNRSVTTRWYVFTVRRDRRHARALIRRHARWLRKNTLPEERTEFEYDFLTHLCGV